MSELATAPTEPTGPTRSRAATRQAWVERIARFAPSGLSLHAAADVYHQALVRELASGAHERLGDAIFAAQVDYAATGTFPELLSIYHLLGDPALKIR